MDTDAERAQLKALYRTRDSLMDYYERIIYHYHQKEEMAKKTVFDLRNEKVVLKDKVDTLTAQVKQQALQIEYVNEDKDRLVRFLRQSWEEIENLTRAVQVLGSQMTSSKDMYERRLYSETEDGRGVQVSDVSKTKEDLG